MEMATANPHFFPINQLPDHILLEIFLRIERQDDDGVVMRDCVDFPSRHKSFTLPPIASVCTRWRRLYFQPQLWRTKVVLLHIVDKLRHPFHLFTELHQMAGEIRNLKISTSVHFGHRFLPMLPTFPAVEQLILDVNLPSRELDFLVEKFPAVQSVEFASPQKLSDAQLLQMAEGWENLRKFHIWTPYGSTKVTGAGLVRFVQLANHIESLDISALRIKNLTDSDFDEITKALGFGLKSIAFGYEQKLLSELAIESLVRNCPQLEQICLHAVPFPISRLKDLADLKCLTLRLELDDCQGFEDLFSRPLSQLRSFEADRVNNLTDSHLELIANSCPQLESLSLSYTRLISDSGLAQIVSNCRNLRVLSLWGFPLLTGRSFIGAGAKLPNLSRLELHECENIDAEMVRRAFVRSTRLQIRSDLPGPWDLRRF